MDIPLLLIILIILTIIAIYYTLNNFRQDVGLKICNESIPQIGNNTRMFDVFCENTFECINKFFIYSPENWETCEYGRYIKFNKHLIDGYDNFIFRIGVPEIINANTLIIFPKNDESKWNNTFFMKCTISGRIFFPEPNSIIVWPNDLIVIGRNGKEKVVLSD